MQVVAQQIMQCVRPSHILPLIWSRVSTDHKDELKLPDAETCPVLSFSILAQSL